MKKALIFSLFISIYTFYGIQKNSEFLKEKLGILESNSLAEANQHFPLNQEISFSVDLSEKEPTLICFKVDGKLYCKKNDKTI
jgi:hypothetical protein